MSSSDTAWFAIRTFKLEDYEAVYALWQSCGLHLRPSDEREEIVKKLERDPDLFLVAEQRNSGRIIGSVIGGWDGRRGWIYHLSVQPDLWRRGIARSLLAQLESGLRAKGALKVNLIVYKDNHGAQRLYEALGYQHEDGCMEMGKPLA